MTSHRSSRALPEPLAAKVPEITLMFWVVKLLTTAAGEATSDYLALGSHAVGAAVEVGLIAIGLAWQFRTRRYSAAAYWFLAYAIAVFGTGVSDTLHLTFGLSYGATTVLWAVILAGVFTTWYRAEGTLSIHSILTTRREMFYWATVFVTFALGTAVGDFTAVSLHLGYLSSVVLFLVAIAMPLAGWRLGLNAVVGFWWAYVLTRPLGASVADYLSKSRALSGAGFGDLRITIAGIVALVIGVAFLVVTRHGVQPPATPPRPAPHHPQPAETP